MKKGWIVTLLLALTLVFSAASADEGVNFETVAKTVVPQDAVYISSEMDDGYYDFRFWSENAQRFYEVRIDPDTTNVVRVESELRDDRGGLTVTLDEKEAEAAVLAAFPEAAVSQVSQTRDDGLYAFKVLFASETYQGKAKVHPESGLILETELIYGASSGASASAVTGAVGEDQARALVLSRVPGGTISKFSQGRDDGRSVFEGRVSDATREYKFEIDAESGILLEWSEEIRRTAAEATSSPAAVQTVSDGLIGTSAAREIALARAGGGRVTGIKLEREKGRQVYEGEIRDGLYEYEFEIDAQTGEIIDWEEEYDD